MGTATMNVLSLNLVQDGFTQMKQGFWNWGITIYRLVPRMFQRFRFWS